MAKRSLRNPAAESTSTRVLLVAGTGLIAVTYGMIRFGYGLYLPVLTEQFALTAGTAGTIAAGSFAAYCLAALIAQRVLVGGSARAVLWGAAAVGAAGSGLVAVSWSAGVLAVGVLVSGSAAGAASPALVTAVACSVPQSSEARAQGIVNAGTGLGVVAGGLFVLGAPQAWRAAWVLSALAAVATAAAVDRATRWPNQTGAAPGTSSSSGLLPLVSSLRRPVIAATAAGAGSAAVWTFGRDLLASTGGLPERTSAVLWCVLGAGAILGAGSGEAVRRWGLRPAWVVSAVATAAGTALLAVEASHAVTAGLAGALFGGAYTALSGVLIAWAGALRPDAAGRGTAVLFLALTAGQALGAVGTGMLVTLVSAPGAFLVAAALLVCAAAIAPDPRGATPGPRRDRP